MTICTHGYCRCGCALSGWCRLGLLSGKMLLAELLAQLLRPVYGQAVVCPVPWVKADDIVVAFHIFPFLVFLIAEIGSHTGNSEILAPAVEGRNAVILPRYQPPVFIKGGFHGKLVMLKCEIGFRCAIVGVFRADMFECCQQRHPLSARLQTLGQQGRKPPPVPPRQAADRDCATRSASDIWFKLPILPYSRLASDGGKQNFVVDGGKRLWWGVWSSPRWWLLPDKLGFGMLQAESLSANSAYSSSVMRVLTTRLRCGVLYRFRMVKPPFCAWCPLTNRRKTGCEAELFLKNPKKYFEGFLSGASRISRVWGRHSPTRFPQGQNERKRILVSLR